MLESLSPSASPVAWGSFWLLLFVSFLIGAALAYYLYNKYTKIIELKDREIKDLMNKGLTAKGDLQKDDDLIAKLKGEIALLKSDLQRALYRPQLDFVRLGSGSTDKKDDLKKISGVGPFIEHKLNKIGIYTFEQISRFTKEDINLVTELIEFFPGRIERDDWKGQAAILKTGGETEFSKRVATHQVDYNKDEAHRYGHD